MSWKGVIIEESFGDKSILDGVVEVGYAESFLEGEEKQGVHFHQFEISDDKKEWFVETSKEKIKPGWYTHICKGSVMVVIFHGKSFEFSPDKKEILEAARDYGLSVGVIRDQMPFEHMITDPFY